MRNWLIEIGVLSIAALVLWRVLTPQHSPIEQWSRRFGVIRSPMMKPPAYKMLLILVIFGALLITVLPESAFVLPALDAVGLDITTVLASRIGAASLPDESTGTHRSSGCPTAR
jgi:hypothetical protein